MEREAALKGFKRLQVVEPRALRVIYWRYKGRKTTEIANKLNEEFPNEDPNKLLNDNHINGFLRRIYDTFDLGGVGDIPTLYPYFLEVFGDPPNYAVEINPAASRVEAERIEVAPSLASTPRQKPTEIPITYVFGVIGVVILALLGLVGFLILRDDGDDGALDTSEMEVAAAPTEPTVFVDDFADGIETTAWNIEFGEPLIVNGELTSSSGELFMTVGEDSWTNYVIEVDVLRAPAGTRNNYICVRCSGDDKIAIVFAGTGDARVWISNNGAWNPIEETLHTLSARDQRLRVVVQGDLIEYYIGLEKMVSFAAPFPSGRVGLKIVDGAGIASFKVTAVP